MRTAARHILTSLAIVAVLFTGMAGRALAAKDQPAELIVEDNAGMFSPDATATAKKIVAASIGKGARDVYIETFKGLSEAEKKEFDAAGQDKTGFWKKWAHAKATGDRGIVILVNRSPGQVKVLADRAMRDAGFSQEKDNHVAKLLLESFRKAKEAKDDGKSEADQQAIRDQALQDAAGYLKNELPRSTVIEKKPSGDQNRAEDRAPQPQPAGSHIGSYICLGVCLLAGIWLVIALIRVFSGGGGMGGGGMGGGGMGGGGGFFPSLLGGLFGGMAGAWMYDRFFGGGSGGWGGETHHGSGLGDGGYYGGDNVGGDTDAPGAGDFSDDPGAGGDFDGGAGGDFGGDSGGGDSGGGDF